MKMYAPPLLNGQQLPAQPYRRSQLTAYVLEIISLFGISSKEIVIFLDVNKQKIKTNT